MIRKAFGDESMSSTRVFESYVQIPRDRKRARQMKSKVKSMLITLFDIKGIIHKEFFLVGQAMNPAYYVTFYGDRVKMCKYFPLTLVTK
jgi:hypothetical protein